MLPVEEFITSSSERSKPTSSAIASVTYVVLVSINVEPGQTSSAVVSVTSGGFFGFADKALFCASSLLFLAPSFLQYTHIQEDGNFLDFVQDLRNSWKMHCSLAQRMISSFFSGS